MILFSRIIILNLIQPLNTKFWKRLLEVNLLHGMDLSLWIILKKKIQPWIWFRYIANIFLKRSASEKELYEFLRRLHSFDLNLKCTH